MDAHVEARVDVGYISLIVFSPKFGGKISY